MISEFDLEQLKGEADVKNYPRGAIIINEGDRAPYNMCILLQGKATVYKNYRKEGEQMLATLGAGDFIGEMSLFLSRPRSATVISEVDTLVLEIDQKNVHNIIKKSPELPFKLIQTLCERLGDDAVAFKNMVK